MGMRKKVLISVGGTGGHVFPAIALAEQLKRKYSDLEILFVGGKLASNRFFNKYPFNYKEILCGSFARKNPFHILKNGYKILRGVWQSRRIIKKYQPDLVIGFGSYHTFPAMVAAKLTNTQIVLYEANSIPGKVNKLMAPYVAITGIHFSDTASLLEGSSVEVGLPLREPYRLGAATKDEAHAYFGLSPDRLTILVFGGSQGAKAINHFFSEAAIHYLSQNKVPFQVLHLTGERDPAFSEDLSKKYDEAGINACVKEFEHQMHLAWTAADIVISRAGASTIAEQIEFEVPGILIPYPYAAEDHQEKNADYLVAKIGGGVEIHRK